MVEVIFFGVRDFFVLYKDLVILIVGLLMGGVINSLFYVLYNRCRLYLENVSFELYKPKKADGSKYKLSLKALLKNKGTRPTSIEKIYLKIGDVVIELGDNDPSNIAFPIHLPSSITEKMSLYYTLDQKDFNYLLGAGLKEILVVLEHTYGRTKKRIVQEIKLREY